MVSILSTGVRSSDRGQVMPLTSEEIVTRAFEDARHDVYHYLLTLGLPAALAQEATQEVFFKLYIALQKGERIESLRGWIFRVAHNQAITLHRQEDLNVVFDLNIETKVTDSQDTPEQALLRKERRLQFHRAVSMLSAQQRTCLYLRAEGFRYREIAEIMGVSDSTVGEFLRRALTGLRKALHV